MQRFLALLLILATFTAKADSQQARMMVHLLDYIAVDYSMAVENGKIISQAEYTEMKEFARTVAELESDSTSAVFSDIILLQKLIDQKASKQKISSVSASIRNQIISKTNLSIAPKRHPSLESGAELFALHCKSCHGPTGKGNGPLAKNLEPKPTNFHAPDKAMGLSPFQSYNTIRLGVQNTSMRAFNELSDDEIWNLAFYISSLPYTQQSIAKENLPDTTVALHKLASLNNRELARALKVEPESNKVAALRLHPSQNIEEGKTNYLDHSISLLNKSLSAYKNEDYEQARSHALSAYLEGVEPIEAKLRANDASMVKRIERDMSKYRGMISKRVDYEELNAHATGVVSLLKEAKKVTAERSISGWMSFLLSSSIILREGLEAFLVVITILSIIRSLNIPRAAGWVHLGWVAALLTGVGLWILAGTFFQFSGAQREVMEGIIAIFAVGVLLYVGFWMHSKSQAGRWQAFVKNRIQALAKTENMVGLAFLSFLVVFREAFESVLFLSAINMEVGEEHQFAFTAGIVSAFAGLAIIAVLLLKYSKKIPIPKLFRYSAIVISILAVILAGKGVHSLQEAGIITLNLLPFDAQLGTIGFYATWETLGAQLITVLLVVILWRVGYRPIKKPLCDESKSKKTEMKAVS